MQRLEVSGAVRPIYGSLGVKRLSITVIPKLNTRSQKVHIKRPSYLFTSKYYVVSIMCAQYRGEGGKKRL